MESYFVQPGNGAKRPWNVCALTGRADWIVLTSYATKAAAEAAVRRLEGSAAPVKTVTRPHESLRLIRPDEVAECWDGVSPDLSRALWDLVPLYDGKLSRMETPPEPDLFAVSRYWSRLAPEHRVALNELAAKRPRLW